VTRVLRGELTVGRLHAVWMLIVLQLQIQMAWGFWNLHLREAWSYPEFMLLLAGPVLLYLSAAVLFPAIGTVQPLDDHVIRRRRPFFVLMAAFMVYSVLFTWLLMGRDFPLVTTSVRTLVFAAFIILACTTRRSTRQRPRSTFAPSSSPRSSSCVTRRVEIRKTFTVSEVE